MMKEQRWELKYAVPSADGGRVEKTCFPRSEEQREKNLHICKDRGYAVLSCKKLYPFNMASNQHNFSLISDICFNRMHDMETGETNWDSAEYDKLQATKEKAERFFCWSSPVAWLTWEDWKDAKELSVAAVIHRQEACIAAGRPDLVQYC